MRIRIFNIMRYLVIKIFNNMRILNMPICIFNIGFGERATEKTLKKFFDVCNYNHMEK